MSKFFAVYDDTTGAVLRAGYCGDRDFANQAMAPTEAVIEIMTIIDPNSFIVDLATETMSRLASGDGASTGSGGALGVSGP